jgi:hypothetical protein
VAVEEEPTLPSSALQFKNLRPSVEDLVMHDCCDPELNGLPATEPNPWDKVMTARKALFEDVAEKYPVKKGKDPFAQPVTNFVGDEETKNAVAAFKPLGQDSIRVCLRYPKKKCPLPLHIKDSRKIRVLREICKARYVQNGCPLKGWDTSKLSKTDLTCLN